MNFGRFGNKMINRDGDKIRVQTIYLVREKINKTILVINALFIYNYKYILESRLAKWFNLITLLDASFK